MKNRILGIILSLLAIGTVSVFMGCGAHEHIYSHPCDTVCDECGSERIVDGHLYDGDCDAFCNKCDGERTAEEHIYSVSCDTECDGCGEKRESDVAHSYESECDRACLLCGTANEKGGHDYSGKYTYNNDATHSSDGTESLRCDNCGFVYETRRAEKTVGHRLDTEGKCEECGWSVPDLSLYKAYESFEGCRKYDVSYYENRDFTCGSIKIGEYKDGVRYRINSRVCEGNVDLRYLRIYRSASENTSGNDGFIDITPIKAELKARHTVEFDIMIGAENEANIYLNGRKQMEDSTDVQFNSFVWYNAGKKRLQAGDSVIVDNFTAGVWYHIAVSIDDAHRTYGVYVDGNPRLINEKYSNGLYPSSDSAIVGLYRITMLKGTVAGDFYLDNIAVYNGEYRAD